MAHFTITSNTLLEHYSQAPPSRVFHYTSSDALIGIISNAEIWATSSMFLNDSTETSHAIEYMRLVIDNRLKRLAYPIPVIEFLKQIAEKLGHTNSRIYIISFSELPDSLAQWRAYCPATGGYAIGFPTEHILDMAKAQGFKLAKCIYDHVLKYRALEEIVEEVIRNFELHDLQNHDEAREAFLNNCIDYIKEVALIMKNEAFADEKEYRLILTTKQLHAGDSMGFRSSNMGVIPYCKFKLTDDEHPSMVKRGETNLVVCIGPGREQASRQLSVQTLLHYHLGVGCGGMATSIPYRTW